MKQVYPHRYYVMTREQHEGMSAPPDPQFKQVRPVRWLYRASIPEAGVFMMRHLSQWFNHILVYDVKEQTVAAMLSNNTPLAFDPMAPEIVEEYLSFKERPEGRYRTVCRRKYAYPHPSSNYQKR